MQSAIDQLEATVVEFFPRWLKQLQLPSDVILVRPYFYDSCAPECFLNCAFITRPTADKLVASLSSDRFCELWSCGQEASDHWDIFPGEMEGFEHMRSVFADLYPFICDDENMPAYATTLCKAAAQLNANDSLQSIIPNLCGMVPADGSCCHLPDATAIRNSLTAAQIQTLIDMGLLSKDEEHFGVYWH